MASIQDFFIRANDTGSVPDLQYSIVDSIIKTAEAMSRSLYQSVYIIDYSKQNFLFVSGNPLFLCGNTAEQVKEMGYSFYLRYVPEKEQEMLLEINKAGFNFFETMKPEEKTKGYISYDFHIMTSPNRKILINHKLTPILLTKEGKVLLALCTVSLSSNKEAGNVEIHIQDSNIYWDYSFESHRWHKLVIQELKEEEKEVLFLSSQGYTMNDIAQIMYKSVDSVKFYKRNLFEKLGTKNITETLSFAVTHKLI